MSYILEALKKAQAERQLGSAPTIHAAVPAVAPASDAVRKPLVAGIAVGALLAVTGFFVWHQQPARVSETAPAVKVAAVTPAADKPVAAAAKAPAAVDKPVPVPASTGQVALVGQADPPAKTAAPETPVVTKPVVAVAARPAPAPLPAPADVARPAAMPPAAPAPAVVAAAVPPAGADESLGGLTSLPEAVRAGVPKVTFGGYMYSPNPADRLVLVDNVLRREGEEVAPGLVLEKLLPKGAVMNYRGNRYRVGF